MYTPTRCLFIVSNPVTVISLGQLLYPRETACRRQPRWSPALPAGLAPCPGIHKTNQSCQQNTQGIKESKFIISAMFLCQSYIAQKHQNYISQSHDTCTLKSCWPTCVLVVVCKYEAILIGLSPFVYFFYKFPSEMCVYKLIFILIPCRPEPAGY